MNLRASLTTLLLSLTIYSGALASPCEDKLALGDKLMAAGDAEAALHFYDQAVTLNNANWKAYVHRGDALMKLGENRFAVDDYKKALQLYPGCAEAIARLHKSSQPGGKKKRSPQASTSK